VAFSRDLLKQYLTQSTLKRANGQGARLYPALKALGY
jgi:hypothetical protein